MRIENTQNLKILIIIIQDFEAKEPPISPIAVMTIKNP